MVRPRTATTVTTRVEATLAKVWATSLEVKAVAAIAVVVGVAIAVDPQLAPALILVAMATLVIAVIAGLTVMTEFKSKLPKPNIDLYSWLRSKPGKKQPSGKRLDMYTVLSKLWKKK